MQTAWAVLSDAHLSDVCIRYGGPQLAAAALRVGCMAAGIDPGGGKASQDAVWEVLSDMPAAELDAIAGAILPAGPLDSGPPARARDELGANVEDTTPGT